MISFVDLPETAFELISRNFDDIRDVLNLELVHTSINKKLQRVFWGGPWSLYMGNHTTKIEHDHEASTSTESKIVTFLGRNMLCGTDVGYDELRQVRHLKHLYIGPSAKISSGPETNIAMHKFLSMAAKTEMALRKIELVYVNPESMLNSSNLITSQCFPSKKTHTKIANLINSQSEYLNELHLYLNSARDQSISIKRNQAKVTVDYNCKCTMGLKQIFYPILSSFSYDSRKTPHTLELFIRQEDPEAILAALDYCLSTCLSGSRSRRACRFIKIELVGALWKQVADAAAEIIPKGMRHLELVRWHFNDEKINSENFNELCCRIQPMKSISTIISTQTYQRIIVATESLPITRKNKLTYLSERTNKFTKLSPILLN